MLAIAIAGPDPTASILTENNLRDRITTLAEALSRERPFFVHALPEFFLVDLDDPGRINAFEALVHVTREWGCAPVVVASGRPGHRHLFVRVQSPSHQKYLEGLARAVGLDVRPSRDIRPPLAPHRLGLLSRLLTPDTVGDALAALATPPTDLPDLQVGISTSVNDEHLRTGVTASEVAQKRIDAPHAPLSDRMRRLLRDGNASGQYQSGSEVVQALAQAAAAAGWYYDELRDALLDPGHEGGASMRRRVDDDGLDSAEGWLLRSWDKAVHRARNNSVPRECDKLQRIQHPAFSGRSGESARLTFHALLDIARTARTWEVNASGRQLAEATGLQRGTVSRALGRLVDAGVLARTSGTMPKGLAHVYVVDAHSLLSAYVAPPLSHPQIPEPSAIDPSHDLWRNVVGLGKNALRIYAEIGDTGATVQDLASGGFLQARTIKKHLRTLKSLGLVVEHEHGWSALPLSLETADRLATEIGVSGRGELQRLQHLREREGFKRTAIYRRDTYRRKRVRRRA